MSNSNKPALAFQRSPCEHSTEDSGQYLLESRVNRNMLEDKISLLFIIYVSCLRIMSCDEIIFSSMLM